jgi:hypothetical protein
LHLVSKVREVPACSLVQYLRHLSSLGPSHRIRLPAAEAHPPTPHLVSARCSVLVASRSPVRAFRYLSTRHFPARRHSHWTPRSLPWLVHFYAQQRGRALRRPRNRDPAASTAKAGFDGACISAAATPSLRRLATSTRAQSPQPSCGVRTSSPRCRRTLVRCVR